LTEKEERSRELKILTTETDYEHLTEILEAYKISTPDDFFHQSVSYWFRPKVKGAIVSQFTILGQIEEWVSNFGNNYQRTMSVVLSLVFPSHIPHRKPWTV